MDINSLLSLAVDFLNTRPYIAIGILVLALGFIYFRPKAAFKSLLVIGFLVFGAYLFLSLNGTMNTGVKDRDVMLEVESGD